MSRVQVSEDGAVWTVRADPGEHIEGVTVHSSPQACDLAEGAEELLEALRDMVARFAPSDDGLSEPEKACAGRARAAIAKATGAHPTEED